MKLVKYISFPVAIGMLIMMGTMLITSCEQDGNGLQLESPDGPPSVSYIRMADPNTSDSLIASAELGTGIVIVGENLAGTREILFNDKAATVVPTWVTNRTIFVDVPSVAPATVTDKIYLIDESGNTLEYPFVVAIPPPTVTSAKNEWPQEGEDLVISGDYFFEPLTVTYTGGVEGTVKSVSQTEVVVSVPADAVEGPITVATNFGEAVSTFHIWDSRNIILNFDDKLPNGWRIGMRETGPDAIDGMYNAFRGEVAANQRNEGPGAPASSPYAFEYWGGNDPNRLENFYPSYPNSYKDYVLKFEAKVNSWLGGYLNICLAPPNHTNSNQEIWSNSINARAIWGPWDETGEEFTTEGKWITVTIPLTEFQYYMNLTGGNVVYTANQTFVESAAGSLSAWLLGSPESDGSVVDFNVDNFRIVPAE